MNTFLLTFRREKNCHTYTTYRTGSVTEESSYVICCAANRNRTHLLREDSTIGDNMIREVLEAIEEIVKTPC